MLYSMQVHHPSTFRNVCGTETRCRGLGFQNLLNASPENIPENAVARDTGARTMLDLSLSVLLPRPRDPAPLPAPPLAHSILLRGCARCCKGTGKRTRLMTSSFSSSPPCISTIRHVQNPAVDRDTCDSPPRSVCGYVS